MIFLWGPPDDDPLLAVQGALDARGAQTLALDQAGLLSSRMLPGPNGFELRTRDRRQPLSSITACYPRPYSAPPPAHQPCHPSVLRHLELMEARLWEWASGTSATVLNRPSPGATNGTKMWQTRVAQQCGLRVPPTLVTTDADRLRQFIRRWGQVICKGAGGTRTIVKRLDDLTADRMPHLTTCPTYFQAYVAGINHRVHLVGAQTFTVAISSDNTDYRYGGCDMTPAVLPAAVHRTCRLVCERLGLTLAGIDLIHGEDGHWYFLEANTSPAFTFFVGAEQIAAAIADELMAPAGAAPTVHDGG